jgi:predicted outer membrane repeat protein
MAYVEVWKSGRLITRRRVDEQKARKGCRIRIGSAGEVRVAVGQSQKVGDFEVRMFEGEPPVAEHPIEETVARPPDEDPRLPPLSVGTPGLHVSPMDKYPDIEGYKIIEPLGRGGMGMVWRAEQLSTRRQVALKLMVSSRIESAKAQARFQREVELTARLDHPNIARIYDSGLHQGMYYYAMELIDGTPLDRYVAGMALSPRQILTLMRTVCQAVHYAHLHGVIHRDLKPSNIMVSHDGQPHVLDFGLARSFLEEQEFVTISLEGEIAGTPAYMSPEQAMGHQDQIDTRTDVFSLGVILYHLLTGRSPHDLSGSLYEVLQRVIEGRITRPREAKSSIDRELEVLLLRALATDLADRYASAGELADDIDNYLDGEPLRARMPTTLYFLSKKVRKHWRQVGGAAVVVVVVLGTVIAAYTRIVGERAVGRAEKERLEGRLDQVSEKLQKADLKAQILGKDKKEAQAALEVLLDRYIASEDRVSELNYRLSGAKSPVPVRRIGLKPGTASVSTALVRRPPLPEGVRSWTLETYGHRSPIRRLAYSPDGGQLASISRDGVIRIWNAKSGQLTRILADPNDAVDLPWLADGHDAAHFSWSAGNPTPSAAEVIKSWGVEVPEVWQPLLRTLTSAALSPDRGMLALGDRDGTIRVSDPKSGRPRQTTVPAWCGPVHSVCFSSDGNVLATCAGWGTICICLWDANRWQPLRRFDADDTTGRFPHEFGTVAWGQSDTVIASPNGHEGAIHILDAQSGRTLRVLYSNRQEIASFPRAGEGGHEGLLKLGSVSWAPGGTFLAGGRRDGKVLVWDLRSDSSEPFVTLDAHTGRASVAWGLDGRSLITAGEDGKIKLWEPRSGKLTAALERPGGPITCLAPSPKGRVLASGSPDGTICLWDVERGRPFNLLRDEPNAPQPGPSVLTAITWSPDGRLLASGNSLGKIHIGDPNSRQPRRSFGANCGSISSLAWSPDGRLLVCGGADGTGRVWDAKNDFQEYVVLLPLWGSAGPGVAISRDGDYRGPPGVAEHLLYVASTEQGEETLTPADFQSRFGWVNEPWQVGLYARGGEQVTRIYVKADAQPPYDGTSWQTAFNDLQDALSIAQANTEIWVAAGTYRPDRGTGAREASFRLKNGVQLFGGFAGTETSLDQRDVNRNKTILSGDLKGDDGPNFANYEDNSYHVVLADRTTASNTVLNGFVITGGNANAPEPKPTDNPDHWGGGLLCGDLTLIRCTFRYNSALQRGGGIAYLGASILQDCAFVGNRTTGDGGAIYSGGGKAVITACTFRGNTSTRYGGAINSENSVLGLTDCVFVSNSADRGGGICTWAYRKSGVTSLTNCRFVGNSAQVEGGGIYCREEETKLMKLRLTNCIFSGNLAMSRGGGIANGYYYEPILVNCTFTKNVAARSGGIYNGDKSKATLTNCILWANSDSGGRDESAQIEGGTMAVNNCCIQGWTGKLGGTGNFGLDPLFDDDLRLKPGSPCRNAGDNSALPPDTADLDKDGDVDEPIPFDIEGRPRILNGVVDLGAYESG